MQNLELETEVVQLSIYCNTVVQLLKQHEMLSVNKTMVFAYLVKKEKYMIKKVYSGNNKEDLVCKALSLMAGEYTEYCENINYIIKAIHLLIKTEQVKINGSILSLLDDKISVTNIFEENLFLKNAVEESKKMSDRQFMKEVVANV